MSDDEVMAVMPQRLKVDQRLLDLVLMSEEASGLIDEQDMRQLNRTIDRQQADTRESSRQRGATSPLNGWQLASTWTMRS